MEAGALQAPAGLSRISIAAPLLRLRSDDQLVALFRTGSEEAFQVIFDRYRQRLFAYTRQMLSGSRQDAEDALQDVFLRAYAALRANDQPISLRAWLYRVAHNRCIDQLRRPVPAHADVFEVSRTPLRDPLAETQRREDLRRLVEDVRRLPEAQRSALLMREMDGLSYQELADALEVTVPAIKSLLVRARIGLVEAIEARDAACTEIRTDLLASHDRGVRASGRARRHLRDCAGCRAYRTELRSLERRLGALSPSGSSPLSLLAKLFGIGGGAGGAAAGGGAVMGGGGVAVVGGGAAAATACKVAALVCSAAIVTGTAREVVHHAVAPAARPTPAARVVAHGVPLTASVHPAAPLHPAARLAPPAHAASAAERRRHRARADVAPSAAVADAEAHAPLTPDDQVYAPPQPAATTDPPTGAGSTGGALAPADDPATDAPSAPAPPPADVTTTTSAQAAGAAAGAITPVVGSTSAATAGAASPTTTPSSGTTTTAKQPSSSSSTTTPTSTTTTATTSASPAP